MFIVDAVGTATPQPADTSVCILCRQPSVFDERMQLRLPSAEELVELATDNRVAALTEMTIQ